MGLSNKSTGFAAVNNEIEISKISNRNIIALSGNPNVGKSTLFNTLTGLKQHTGNWPGKTVLKATGSFSYKDNDFILVDLPGAYSLAANSAEEETARDFICFGNADAVIVVIDATCTERNLNLVLQTIEISKKVVVCVNLMDEARRKGIMIDTIKLSDALGVPVVGISAINACGIDRLLEAVNSILFDSFIPRAKEILYNKTIETAISMISGELDVILKGRLNTKWVALKLFQSDDELIQLINKQLQCNLVKALPSLNTAKNYLAKNGLSNEKLCDEIASALSDVSKDISRKAVYIANADYDEFDRKIDRVLTSKSLGLPIMAAFLGLIFYITIWGANYPSVLLAKGFNSFGILLEKVLNMIKTPFLINDIIINGVYKTLSWVIAVMLPPMAIFFPLFTLLEDLGYLPRVAFNLDNYFKKACACGKQALTMCMGFGCNAAGIIGCRIITSPRERLIAILTNSFIPCNGKFPMLIAIITMFFTAGLFSPFREMASAAILTFFILIGITATLVVSKIISTTLLKGIPSTFALELPPYRRPQVGKIIIRSVLDRTIFVLSRAVLAAIPAGVVLWIMVNIKVGDISLLSYLAGLLQPFASLIGLDGYILMAFILGFPANEIVIPIVIMCYMSINSLIEFDNLAQLKQLLVANGWTVSTAICTMLFSLLHWPCATACMTVKKETKSFKWTVMAFLIPTISGIGICFICANLLKLFGL